MPNQEIVDLRNRILGILIQNARNRVRVSREECAAMLGISEEHFAAYESATRSISLPELELLARYLELPLSTFRSAETLNESAESKRIPDADLFLPLRHRIVGARLRQLRLENERTQQELAEILECSDSTISDYEYGRRAIPVAELEVLCRAMGVPLDYFVDHESEVGRWHQTQQDFDRFMQLDPDIRDFVLRQINISYLELAMKLSAMPAGALRAIAEGILEITY